jgi:hypothetical protein
MRSKANNWRQNTSNFLCPSVLSCSTAGRLAPTPTQRPHLDPLDCIRLIALTNTLIKPFNNPKGSQIDCEDLLRSALCTFASQLRLLDLCKHHWCQGYTRVTSCHGPTLEIDFGACALLDICLVLIWGQYAL